MLGKALFGALKGAGKLAFGGGGRRMVTGAGVGTIYGAASSDQQSATGVFRDAALGGLAGLGIGAATTRLAGRTALGTAKGMFGIGGGRGLMGPLRSPVAKMASGGVRAGIGAANFAIYNPRTALAIGAAGLGAYGLSQTGASNIEGDTAQMAMNRGTSSGRQSFVQSAEGLVQGLHQGRH